jgi:hypothetical protein
MIPEYGKLFENPDHGKSTSFYYTSNLGSVYFSFILRAIKINDVPTGYFDIISPYGYGGPVILECPSNDKIALISDFDREFSIYCRENNIVSEFVRFHPLLNNVAYCKNIYDVELNRNTIAIDLTLDDLFMESFSSKCRNMIRKAEKNGVSVSFDFEGQTVSDFYRLYTRTMQKNNASGYYFFTEEYFNETLHALHGKIFILNALFESEIVSAAMFMYYQKFMHYHFSATDPEHYKLSCNNLILSEAAYWGQKNQKEIFHLGGGFTTAADDPLFFFKKSFTKNGICDFWIGRRIHQQNIYQEFVKQVMATKSMTNPDFFPLYRT